MGDISKYCPSISHIQPANYKHTISTCMLTSVWSDTALQLVEYSVYHYACDISLDGSAVCVSVDRPYHRDT